MALQKQPVILNFGKGLDLKTDPYQVPVGSFLSMQNSVFDTAGRLTKRNGFNNITTLPNDLQTTLTTLNDNLIATGSNLYSYNAENDTWIDKGTVQPVNLAVQPLVRVSTSQTSPDAGVAPNGLVCTAYMDNGTAYYEVSDSNTGEQVVSRQEITSGTQPRVFVLKRYFIITFCATVSGSPHLRYIAIPISSPNSPGAVTDISNTITSNSTGYDGVVANDTLYLGYGKTASDVGYRYLTSTLVVSAETVVTGYNADVLAMAADVSGNTPTIYSVFYDSNTQDGFAVSFDQTLAPILAATSIISGEDVSNITLVAVSGLATVIYETINYYNSTGSYPSAIRTDYLSKVTVTSTGTVTIPTIILRSVGLGSKAFYAEDSGIIYVLAAYGLNAATSNEPSYFLIDSDGNIYMRLAYSNGGGYAATQVLPNVSLIGAKYYIAYLINDFIATVNKNTGLPANSQINAIYTQTGVNLAIFSINNNNQYSSNIAGALHLTGGQLWEYDSVKPVEFGFQVWPEDVQVDTSGTGGSVGAGTYFYQFTYEWTDAQGNLHRSAPSIPVSITTTGGTSENTLYVPTLRLTYKTAPNPVRIVGYRWSQAQQVYYQFTSLTSPTLNDPSIDYVVISDTLADSSILGNNIIYTTGGVIENIAPPASIASALFKNRLFLVDAEDRNLLWYSKQVIENVPVEMSDLFTIYVAPTTGAQGSTGPVTALSALDDKLIIFKRDAIYYLTGNGPDNTGANNDFSDPIYITSSVGCVNPNSIVLMPNGLMFQSDKGIWLLSRDLGTAYIGAPVESYNSATVKSAQTIPGTNQVRFILDTGITLMYDYYYGQWGTFTNIQAISATLYENFHTYLNKFGAIYQEKPGTYVDGSVPVLMSYTTSWLNVAGLRGFERFYFMFLLGTYFTPFKLNVQLAYDYDSNAQQSIIVTPDNYTPAWGGEALWGSGEQWGGPGNVFQARLFPSKQKCQTFQISVNEIYDSSFGVSPGQGLSISGMNIVIGLKKGYSTQKAARSFG